MARAAIAFSSKQHVRRRKTRDDDGQGAITSSSKQHVRRRKTREDDGGAGLPQKRATSFGPLRSSNHHKHGKKTKRHPPGTQVFGFEAASRCSGLWLRNWALQIILQKEREVYICMYIVVFLLSRY
jgi:hypothetical protein